jgi:hypothetical protein
MTKEDLLKSYLNDPLVLEKGYLDESELKNFSWNDGKGNNLVEALKIIIKETSNNKGEKTIAGLVNRVMDNTL